MVLHEASGLGVADPWDSGVVVLTGKVVFSVLFFSGTVPDSDCGIVPLVKYFGLA